MTGARLQPQSGLRKRHAVPHSANSKIDLLEVRVQLSAIIANTPETIVREGCDPTADAGLILRADLARRRAR
jgi:hypothetical protein